MAGEKAAVALVERSGDRVRVVKVTKKLVVQAERGTIYSMVSEDNPKLKKNVVLKRVGKTLIVESTDDGQIIEIRNFYDEQNAGTYFDPQANGQYFSAQSGAAANVQDAVTVWPASQDAALGGLVNSTSAAGAGESSLPWLALALGGLAIGGAAAGFSGGGGGSSAPAAVTQNNNNNNGPAPTTMQVAAADTDGPMNGVDIRVTIPNTGVSAGDTVTVTVTKAGVTETITFVVTDPTILNYTVTAHYTGGDPLPDGAYTINASITHGGAPLATATNTFNIALGVLQDDFIAGATVFIDANNDGVLNAGEQSTVTDAQGRFYFSNVQAGASIVAVGGVDTTSGVANKTLSYKAFLPTGDFDAQIVDVVMSPLSTLVASLAQVNGGGTITVAAIQAAALKAVEVLGLPASVTAAELLTLDAASAAGTDPNAAAILSVNRQLNAVMVSLTSLVSGAAADAQAQLEASTLVVRGIAESIASLAANQTVDLTSSADLSNVVATTFDVINRDSTTGVTASNASDVQQLASVFANINATLSEATATQFAGGADANAALERARAAMQFVSNTVAVELQQLGEQARAERTDSAGAKPLADISFSALVTGLSATSLGQFTDATRLSDTLQVVVAESAARSAFDIVSTVTFGDAAQYLPLSLQLPGAVSVAPGASVVTLTGLEGIEVYKGVGTNLSLIQPNEDGAYVIRLDEIGLLRLYSEAPTAAIFHMQVAIASGDYEGDLGYFFGPKVATLELGDNRELHRGNLTSDTTPTISGTLVDLPADGQRVAIFDRGTFVGYADFNPDDLSFEFDWSGHGTAAEGDHVFTARVVQDDNGVPLEVNRLVVAGATSSPFNIAVFETAGAFSVEAASALEVLSTDTSTTTIQFKIVRSNDNGQATVDWVATGIAAELYGNGELPSGTLAFADGEMEKVITIEVPLNATLEAVRTVTVSLSNVTGAYTLDVGNSSAAIDVVDNSIPAGVALFAVTPGRGGVVQEGADGDVTEFTYTVTYTGDFDGGTPITVNWNIAPIGAEIISANDFDGNAIPSDTLTFDADHRTQVVRFSVKGDNEVGGDEAFKLNLSGLPAGSLVFGSLTGTLVNDDAFISVVGRAIDGAGSGEPQQEFVIRRTGATNVAHTVHYSILPTGESGVDLSQLDQNALEGDIVFEAGDTADRIISVPLGPNSNIAGLQTVKMVLTAASDSNVTLVNDVAIASIEPNHIEVEVQSLVDRVLEGTAPGSAGHLEFKISRGGNTDLETTLNWNLDTSSSEYPLKADDFASWTITIVGRDGSIQGTQSGTAFPAGSITLAPGETEAFLTIVPREDNRLDGNQSFRLQVSAEYETGVEANNVQIVQSVATTTGIIFDDECAVGFSTEEPPRVYEGDNGTTTMLVTVTRVGFSGGNAEVEWRVTPDEAKRGWFAEGQDLLGDNDGFPSGTVEILPGEGSASTTIDLLVANGVLEADKTFGIELSNPSPGTKLIGVDADFAGYDSTVAAVIANDDSVLSLEASVQQIEGQGGSNGFIAVTVSRTGSTKGSDWADWSLVGAGNNPADNTDLGQENDALAAFTTYQSSFINFVTLSDSQNASGSIALPKSGYIIVAYNRDEGFDSVGNSWSGGDGINLPFDQFLLKSMSIQGGTITSLGTVTNTNFIADNVAIGTDGNYIFEADGSLSVPSRDGGGNRIVISSDAALGGVYFEVNGYDKDGNWVSERVHGPAAGGSVATATKFATVESVVTVDAAIALGITYDNSLYDYRNDPSSYNSEISVDVNGGRLDIGWGSGYDKSGAVQNDLGYLTITSDANFSDAKFLINAGIAIAHFDTTYGYDANIAEEGPTWKQAEIPVPAKVLAEQVSFDGQANDGVALPN